MMTRSALLLVSALAALAGCDKPSSGDAARPATTLDPTAIAHAVSSSARPASSPPPAPPPPSASTPPANVLTPERRAKIEAAIPEAKDFLDAKELGKEVAGKPDFNSAFAALAASKGAGKYILFLGAMNNLESTSFSVAVTMMEIDPNSPFGAPKWMMFTAKDIKGYDKSKYEAGAYGAILAKYPGKGLAIGPGYDLVALGDW
jgi:hypothetical protein